MLISGLNVYISNTVGEHIFFCNAPFWCTITGMHVNFIVMIHFGGWVKCKFAQFALEIYFLALLT